MSNMQPLKPYLIRAYYEWIKDSNHTPYLLIQADLPHVVVPTQYIDPNDQCIVLDISPTAVESLKIDNHSIQFQASFDGIVWNICAPYYAVNGIYAQENEEGLMFETSKYELNQGIADFNEHLANSSPTKKQPQSHAHLRIVKNTETT